MLESNILRGGNWERLLSTAISQVFDPAPIRFTDRDVVRGRVIVTACRRGTGDILQLRTAIPRKAFLAACFDLTAGESREHLIVGFGTRTRNSTFVGRIIHRLGEAGYVSFPPELRGEIANYVLSGHRHEVLVFHNHPLNMINAICDNEPWASPQDRAIAMSHAFDPRMLVKTITNGGRIRFYVGENDYVREFTAPDVFTLLKSMSSS